MPQTKTANNNFSEFLLVFVALNVVFAYYQITFFWGNHDWDWVKGTTQVLSLDTGLFEGRYAKFILNVILFSGQVLPLLNTLVAFALLALGQVLLLNYWQIKQPTARGLIALLPVLTPFILGWLYFPINILGNFAAVPLVAGGLILAEKQGMKAKITAVLCFLTALGVYPSVMEMMFICWGARQILVPQQIKNMLPAAVIILTSLLVFKLTLYGLEKAGLIYAGHYNMQTVSFKDMFARLPQMGQLILSQMSTILPFFPIVLKATGIGILVCALFLSARCPLNMALWVIMLGATVLSSFLTAVPAETAYMPRVNFYGLNYLYAAAAAVILTQAKVSYRNIGTALSIAFIFLSVNQNFEAQKVWHLGKTAEEKLTERVISRITEKEPKTPLTPVIAGELPLRPRYYAEKYAKPSPYILNAPLMVRHIPSGMLNFYTPEALFKTSAQISTLTPALYNYLKNASSPWPSSAGVYVDENYAVLLLTPEGIKAIQAQLP